MRARTLSLGGVSLLRPGSWPRGLAGSRSGSGPEVAAGDFLLHPWLRPGWAFGQGCRETLGWAAGGSGGRLGTSSGSCPPCTTACAHSSFFLTVWKAQGPPHLYTYLNVVVLRRSNLTFLTSFFLVLGMGVRTGSTTWAPVGVMGGAWVACPVLPRRGRFCLPSWLTRPCLGHFLADSSGDAGPGSVLGPRRVWPGVGVGFSLGVGVTALPPTSWSPIWTLSLGMWGKPHSLLELSNISAPAVSIVTACAT